MDGCSRADGKSDRGEQCMTFLTKRGNSCDKAYGRDIAQVPGPIWCDGALYFMRTRCVGQTEDVPRNNRPETSLSR